MRTDKDYNEFLQRKLITIPESGFEVQENELNPALFNFQKFIVKKALAKGRYAIFADCGLGKTLMQMEWAYQIYKKLNKSILILTPLAVSQQTINEGKKFGYNIIKIKDDNYQKEKGIYISNYEQLDNIESRFFTGIVADESSIIKDVNGEIRNKLINNFNKTPYKLACTATPSPNDPMELGNHSEFLNSMTRNEMLSMYFIHDGGETAKWRLKGHAIDKFWNFVSNWSIMLTNPKDLGFNGDNYILPKLNFIEKQIETEQRENGLLFNSTAVNATDFHKELRLTLIPRLENAADIVNNSNENFIVWIAQNEEEKIIKSLIHDSVVVNGGEPADKKESKLLGFANNEFRVLITKKKIAQFGLNFQNCNNQIFASLDFSFEGLYQAIRRSYRFGQTKPVNVYIITTDTMENVLNSIKTKQKQFEEMQRNMTNSILEHSENSKELIKHKDLIEKSYRLMYGDCIQRIKEIPNNSIDFSVFSPPFADLYTYSDKLEDMGNSKNYDEFVKHFEFLVIELERVIKEGRLISIHCMDLPILKSKEGFIGLRDFSGMFIQLFTKHGFIYHNRITIWKDPVIEMQRTKALGLLHKQLKKDSSMSRTGTPDYILTFRKFGENKTPIIQNMNVDKWQKLASPIWNDINYSNTLQYTSARDNNDEKHICPLQLDTIERLIQLYSNKDEIVLSTFMGIGSEGYVSMKLKRKFIGIELKESYFNAATKNIKNAYEEFNQLNLFEE